MEEVATISKRLKNMTSEVSAARRATKTNGNNSVSSGVAQRPANRREWLEKELELASTLQNAKQMLDTELTTKQSKTHELQMLQRQVFCLKKKEAPPASISRLEESIAQIQSELESKSSSVAELQRTVQAGADEPAARRWDHIKNMDEAKLYLKMLFTQLVSESIQHKQLETSSEERLLAASQVLHVSDTSLTYTYDP